MSSEADDPQAALVAGVAALRERRLDEARASFEQVLRLSPGHIAARTNLASALWGLGLREAAEEMYRRVLADSPDNVPAARNLQALVRERIARLRAGGAPHVDLDTTGLDAAALLERSDEMADVGRLAEALAACLAAGEDETFRYEALVRAAFLEASLARHEDASRTLHRAIALQPDNPMAYHRRSFLRLLASDFAGGWEDYEYRLESPETFKEGGALKRVANELAVRATPEQLAGRRVLVVAEQGIGDQVMFASMLPDLARVASEVICVCDGRLAGLFSRSLPGVRVLGVPGARIRTSEYDVVLAMGSLARLFRTRLEDFPGAGFLTADPQKVADWTARLGPRPRRLRVGLSWLGGSQATGRNRRSVSLADLRPILDLPDCHFVSLQYGDVADEVAAMNRELASPIALFAPDAIDDFDDLAALAKACDVVVSVQNSLVHLCGAIGQDCLTLLPNNPEWRYTLAAETMPWYRSVRLFRQAYAGDWIPVIQRVAEALQRRTPV